MRKGVCLLLFVVATLSAGCASIPAKGGKKKGAAPVLLKTPEMERSFHEAEALFYAKRFHDAQFAYQSYLSRFPVNVSTAKAYFRLGEIRFHENDMKKALSYYKRALGGELDREWGEGALYKEAICFFRLGEMKKALGALDRIPADLSDPTLGLKAGSLRVSVAKKLEDPLEEKRGYLELINSYEAVSPMETKVGELNWIVSEKTAREEVRQWIASDEKEDKAGRDLNRLKEWVKNFQGKSSGGTLSWKLVRLYHAKGDYENAALWCRQYLEGYPKHEYVSQARLLLEEMDKRGETVPAEGKRSSVGVLLPLSGKFAVYGESVLHGLECAAGIFAPCRGDLGVNLIIRDTEGDPKIAARIVDEFAQNDEIRAIVGPLPQVEVDEAVSVAEKAGLPMITLSQKPDVAKEGNFIFRNFLTVADQVATLVDYACGEKKWKKFAVLTPQGSGGEEYLKEFEKEVNAFGGTIVARASYPPGTKNLTEAVRALKFSVAEQRADEPVPFEALFFPDVYRRVAELLTTLKFLNLSGVHLLGGAGWDHPGLVGGSPEGLNGSIFVDGFFSKGSNYATRDFVSTFQTAYGVEPTLLEAYAYDTLRLLGSVIKEHLNSSRSDLQKSLSHLRNFSGVTGDISFDEEGDARRKLFILTVDQGTIKEVP